VLWLACALIDLCFRWWRRFCPFLGSAQVLGAAQALSHIYHDMYAYSSAQAIDRDFALQRHAAQVCKPPCVDCLLGLLRISRSHPNNSFYDLRILLARASHLSGLAFSICSFLELVVEVLHEDSQMVERRCECASSSMSRWLESSGSTRRACDMLFAESHHSRLVEQTNC
jgi:hypothetical protein